jgi:hypothetical protein
VIPVPVRRNRRAAVIQVWVVKPDRLVLAAHRVRQGLAEWREPEVTAADSSSDVPRESFVVQGNVAAQIKNV